MGSRRASYHETLYYLMKKAEKERGELVSCPFSKKPVERSVPVASKRTRLVAGLRLLKRLAGY